MTHEFKFGDRVEFCGGLGRFVTPDPLADRFAYILLDTGHLGVARMDDIQPAPPSNTVPVRIAVAALSDGEWASAGWSNASDGAMADAAKNCLPTGERVSFITAHVPLPEKPAEVEGSVEHE